MKLKTRLIIAFVTVIAFPILLGALFIFMLGQYQLSMIEKNYELKGTTVESSPTRPNSWDSLRRNLFMSLQRWREVIPGT